MSSASASPRPRIGRKSALRLHAREVGLGGRAQPHGAGGAAQVGPGGRRGDHGAPVANTAGPGRSMSACSAPARAPGNDRRRGTRRSGEAHAGQRLDLGVHLDERTSRAARRAGRRRALAGAAQPDERELAGARERPRRAPPPVERRSRSASSVTGPRPPTSAVSESSSAAATSASRSTEMFPPRSRSDQEAPAMPARRASSACDQPRAPSRADVRGRRRPPRRSIQAVYCMCHGGQPPDKQYTALSLGARSMAETTSSPPVSFETHPARYKHWKLAVDGGRRHACDGRRRRTDPLWPGYELKLNSYDLGVDIELADAVQRDALRAPRGRASWSSTSGKDRIFCSGANIYMLGSSTARVQGELLQVHQRDAPLPRGRRAPSSGIRVARRAATAPRPAAATSSRSRATRSSSSDDGNSRGPPPRGAAARRAARHRRPHAPRRQAQGPPRPRRRVLARSPRASAASARRSGASSTASSRAAKFDGAVAEARRGARAAVAAKRRQAVPAVPLGPLGAKRTSRPARRVPATSRSRSTAARTANAALTVRRARRAAAPAAPHGAALVGAARVPRARRRAPRLRFNHPDVGLVVLAHRAATRRRCSPSTPRSSTARATGFAREVALLMRACCKRLDLTRGASSRSSSRGILLRRLPARARARRRPLLHARRRRRAASARRVAERRAPSR